MVPPADCGVHTQTSGLTAPIRINYERWVPQPGPQALLLACPVREIFYGGARGGGKTDGMLGHWEQHWRQYGALASGIVFRRRYKQLARIIERGKQLWLPLGAKFLESKDKYWFEFPGGGVLRMRHLQKTSDAEEYQGHEYNWLAFEELPQWPDPTPIDMLLATLRDSRGVPCWFISNGNPGGVGHNWVKERYISPAPPFTPFVDPATKAQRIFLPAKLEDNPILMQSDPLYKDRLRQTGPDWLVSAWLEGNWDIVVGGFLTGIWSPDRHIVKPFPIPPHWTRWRAMDWGFARPYSIGWYARNPDGRVFRYRELYGVRKDRAGKFVPNAGSRESATEVAARVLDIEKSEARLGITFRRNPADSQLWHGNGTEQTPAQLMQQKGVRWVPASKGPGSRKSSAQVVVDLLQRDALAVFDTCRHFLRTVPVIPADEDDPEDVDDEAEDHAWDELRYAVTSRQRRPTKPPPPDQDSPFRFEQVIANG